MYVCEGLSTLYNCVMSQREIERDLITTSQLKINKKFIER